MTPSVLRKMAVLRIVAVFLLGGSLLAGCGLPQPFRHDSSVLNANALVTLRAGVGVTVLPVANAPLPMDRMIALDVAAALRDDAEIPAAVSFDPGADHTAGLHLIGQVQQAQVEDGRVALTLDWRLTSPRGAVLGENTQSLSVSAEDWLHTDPAVSERVAREGIAPLAALVAGEPVTIADGAMASSDPAEAPADGTRDAAAQTAAQTAPQMAPQMATSDTTRPASGVGAGGPRSSSSGSSGAPSVASAGAAASSPQGLSQPAPSQATAPRPIVMAPPQITAAPGDGKKALAVALTRLLKLNNVLITKKPVPGRFHVVGSVQVVAAETPSRQTVSLVWRVLGEDGQELGQLTQTNEIPAGTLDGAWGDTAYAVAEAALMGVGEILVRKGGVVPPGGG